MRTTPSIKISKPAKDSTFTMTTAKIVHGDEYWFTVAVMNEAALNLIYKSAGEGWKLNFWNFASPGWPEIQFETSPTHMADVHATAIQCLGDAIQRFSSGVKRDNHTTARVPLIGSLWPTAVPASDSERRAM